MQRHSQDLIINQRRNFEISKACHLQKLYATCDQSICSTVLVLIPAVGSANFDIRESFLHVVDAREQFWTGKVASVEGLGANSDGIDRVRVLRNVLL